MINRRFVQLLIPVLLVSAAGLLTGCPIPQPPGKGKTSYLTCRAMPSRNYWLYIPENYDSERRYPLVVTLHGMKPYDVSNHHVRMWGRLADEHRFIIVAPELVTSDSFGQFPLTRMNSSERKDVQAVLAIMDEVMTDWGVDRNAVLLSSWSMGGYLAHYMATEFGNRFTAFAPLQSNFCNDVLTPEHARQWNRRLSMFVFYGTLDFPKVTSESKESVEWYRSLGFNVQTKTAAIGHQRHPELAAQFFETVLARQQKNVDIVVTPPNAAPAPLAVNLWPALSSKIGEVVVYKWEFERLGGPSYQKNPNVLIRTPGDYPVKLTVIDKLGQQHYAQTVLHAPAAPTARTSSYPR